MHGFNAGINLINSTINLPTQITAKQAPSGALAVATHLLMEGSGSAALFNTIIHGSIGSTYTPLPMVAASGTAEIRGDWDSHVTDGNGRAAVGRQNHISWAHLIHQLDSRHLTCCARLFAAVAPRIVNLRQDPFEFAPERNASWNYQEWMFRRGYVYVPAQGIVGGFVKSFKDYPPRGLPASFSVGDALKKISEPQHN